MSNDDENDNKKEEKKRWRFFSLHKTKMIIKINKKKNDGEVIGFSEEVEKEK